VASFGVFTKNFPSNWIPGAWHKHYSWTESSVLLTCLAV